MRTTYVALLGLMAASCTSKPAEAPVQSVASPTAAPIPYRASPSGATAMASPSATGGASAGARPVMASAAPAPAPAPRAESGEIHWYSSIADAQAEARATGRLILVGSTKPGCGLCEKFAHTIAPQCWSRLSQIAVPFMYDISHYDTRVAENVRVDSTLRNNLRGAALMPLVGFLTPDLQWVHGFSGPRSVAEFMGDIESARRIYPVHAAGLPRPAPIGSPVSVVNEFGEREWSAPAEWPAPEDALGPVASVTAPAPTPAAVEPTPAAGDPSPAIVEPVVEHAPVAAATVVEPTPAAPAPESRDPEVGATPAPAWSEPAAPVAAVPANLAVSAAAPTRAAVVVPAVRPDVATVQPTEGMTETEANAALRDALATIRAGRFDEARASLKRVSRALPNTAVAREADRGAVAVYNARLISTAPADQRDALVQRARKDLGSSMWADLF